MATPLIAGRLRTSRPSLPDHGRETPCMSMLPAVREELMAMATGAQASDLDMLYADLTQLQHVGPPQIEVGFAIGLRA